MADYITSQQFDKFLQEETEHHKRAEDAGAERGKQIAAIDNKIDSLYKWRVQVDKKLEKHEHFLFGNGQPGIDEVLRNVNTWIDEQKKAAAEDKKVDKEIKLAGIKMSSETRVVVIQGVITLTGIVLTALLVGK